MKVKTLIDDVFAKIDTTATESDMLEWVNELERNLYRSALMERVVDGMDVVGNAPAYSLSAVTYAFEDIITMTVCDVQYTRAPSVTSESVDPLGPYTPSPVLSEDAYTYAKYGLGFKLTPSPATSVENGITIYHYKIPTLKTSDNMATEDLSIIADFKAYEYIDLYRYWMYRKACLANREFGDANSYGVLYNEMEDAFWTWYMRNQARDTAAFRKTRWR